MALILERLDARRNEVLRRMVLDRTPITIGRALDNDLVLDDPHVDAHHARIIAAEDGLLVLEDLGSVNGIDVPGTGRETRVTLGAGASVRLGRTPLRVRDRAEAVVPAIPLAAANSSATPAARLTDIRWQLALIVVVLLNSADSAWIGTSTNEGMTETLAVVVALVALLALWAGAWAIVGKIITRRADFLTHVAIAALATLVLAVAAIVRSWAEFLVPAAGPTLTTLVGIVTVVVLAVNLYQHLSYATNLTSRARITGVVSVVGGIALLIGAFVAVADDAFTDIPKFLYGIKRAPAAVIPAGDLDDFRNAMSELRVEVDSLKSTDE